MIKQECAYIRRWTSLTSEESKPLGLTLPLGSLILVQAFSIYGKMNACASLAKSMHLELDLLALSSSLPSQDLRFKQVGLGFDEQIFRSITIQTQRSSFDDTMPHPPSATRLFRSPQTHPKNALCPFQPKKEFPVARLHHIDLELTLIFINAFLCLIRKPFPDRGLPPSLDHQEGGKALQSKRPSRGFRLF